MEEMLQEAWENADD
ncbi:hypothetical protein NGK65_06605 [Serratia ureilytica]|nr:hypothetical protein [Serratia ureilytica]